MKTLKTLVLLAVFVTVVALQVSWAAEAPIIAEGRLAFISYTATDVLFEETCTGGGCGEPTSTHPKSRKEVATSSFGWIPGSASDPVLYTKTVDFRTGPVYNDHITMTQVWSNNPDGGYEFGYSQVTGSYTNPCELVSIYEKQERGQLTVYTTNADYFTKVSTAVNSMLAFRYRNTDPNWSYTFRFTVIADAYKAKTLAQGATGPLEVEYDYDIPWNALTVRNQTLHDDGEGGAYFDFVVGPNTMGQLDVTPSVTGVAYYHYNTTMELTGTSYTEDGGAGGQD